MLRVLKPADYRRTRWKNDGGWTTEIAIAGATDGGGFDWRVSIADIESDGPFSSFPGIERDLLLLSGKGIELEFGDGTLEVLDQRLQGIHFAGERQVQCRLLGGPTRDFNVMVRREACAAEVHARPLNGTMLVFVEPGTTWLIHVLAGQASARIEAEGIELATQETLLVEATGAGRQRLVLEGGGELVLVRFSAAASATDA